jgi:hypothetical protein
MGQVALCMALFHLAAPALSASAEPPALSFRDMVQQADARASYVAMVAPTIAKHCLETVWGAHPPDALRNWVADLMRIDLENRAKVLRGELQKQEADLLRQAKYYSLEDLPDDHFKAVATYADMTPSGRFGERLTQVMDCQYRAVAEALVTRDAI